MEEIQFRPLGKARNIVERMALAITHIHDDLIFIEHNAFILRFDDACENNLFLHFNEISHPSERDNIALQVSRSAQVEGFTIQKGKHFKMEQKAGSEEIQIIFI
ncbi:MAG: hypothetical protein GVY19_13315 [Bacteroidetes bacterium]|jgi:hypothetical protein|nr:hypothetical protein [Bacteroidota bacterium]